jgi:hypothetical protein
LQRFATLYASPNTGTECNRVAAKRFREFLDLPSHVDLKSNDDTADIVGFLAFEMVHSLTVAALDVKKALEESYLRQTSPLRIYWVYASPILELIPVTTNAATKTLLTTLRCRFL